MGYRGEISIYDYGGFIKNLSKDDIALVKKRFLSSSVYIQTLEGKEYLTVYQADNCLNDEPLFDVMLSYDVRTKKFARNDYNYILKCISVRERKRLHELSVLLEEFNLTYWEVWS